MTRLEWSVPHKNLCAQKKQYVEAWLALAGIAERGGAVTRSRCAEAARNAGLDVTAQTLQAYWEDPAKWSPMLDSVALKRARNWEHRAWRGLSDWERAVLREELATGRLKPPSVDEMEEATEHGASVRVRNWGEWPQKDKETLVRWVRNGRYGSRQS